MFELFERVYSGIQRVWETIKAGWARLTGTDRTVTAIAGGLVVGGLLMGGIMAQGAAFALSMCISLGLLSIMVPPLLRTMIKHRVAVDYILALGALTVGFTSGAATVAIGLTFFGLCVTAGLRIGKAAEHMLPDLSWKQIFPFGVAKLLSKHQTTMPEFDPCI